LAVSRQADAGQAIPGRLPHDFFVKKTLWIIVLIENIVKNMSDNGRVKGEA